jgi:hypothetical protein
VTGRCHFPFRHFFCHLLSILLSHDVYLTFSFSLYIYFYLCHPLSFSTSNPPRHLLHLHLTLRAGSNASVTPTARATISFSTPRSLRYALFCARGPKCLFCWCHCQLCDCGTQLQNATQFSKDRGQREFIVTSFANSALTVAWSLSRNFLLQVNNIKQICTVALLLFLHSQLL